ncbi:MAG TPA: Uxx-star family glutaredoxin-like (seleno)protein [Vicinamibacterales bacterium]|jgi:glutaredoxin
MVDVGPSVELFGTTGCPYTSELREHLMWNGIDFVEYDVEADETALSRLRALTGRRAAVPVLVEDGRVTEIGWRGRSCLVLAGPEQR